MRELEGHLDRGELDFAIALAKVAAGERTVPLGLDLTLRFLPLVAVKRPQAYDMWSLRWLEQWCAELRGRASIDDAHDVAAALAEIPVDPSRALETLTAVSARHARPASA